MNDHKPFTKIFPIYCALISPCVQFPGAIFWLVLTSPSLCFHVHLPVIGGERGSASHICLMVHLCLRHTPEQVSMINVWKNGWRNEQIIILNLRQSPDSWELNWLLLLLNDGPDGRKLVGSREHRMRFSSNYFFFIKGCSVRFKGFTLIGHTNSGLST